MSVEPGVDDIQEFLGATATAPQQSEVPGALPIGLPMPRNASLLFDPTQRVHVTRGVERRFPFPIPNGWFIVAATDELAVGEAQALFAFGRDLVLFRTEAGEPRVLDAHCPHLGAHLAVGGRVEADCIRCPFHGWSFDGESGTCTEIPYGGGTRIPQRAQTRSYPTLERNHMVWAWYHAEGAPPFYDVPVVDEFHDPDWQPILVKEFDIAIAAQEMAENNVDYSHFRYVHGTDGIPEDTFVTEGTYKRAVGQEGNFVREGFGLGLGVLRVKNWVTFLSSTTPIDESHVHVRWIFTTPKANGDDALTQASDSFCEGLSQDIPIWENKIYRPHPVLTRSERPILEHRRWARQFYSAYEEDIPTTTEEDE